VGVQSAIRLNGRLVFSGSLGLADRDRNLPVSQTTRFPIASVTKAFTGVATLQAAASGRLNLDAPIGTYVPEFPVKPELTVTPRRLAAHRAGIRHWGPERDGLYTRRFDRLAQILPLFAADPLLGGAGTEYQYSSYGYNLLGLAIERATGTGFTRYVERRILRPLALSRTSFDDARRPAPGLTKLYSAFDLTRMTPEGYAELPPGTPLTEVLPRDYSHNMAGGNMSSTAEDLVRFGDALLRPGFLNRREHEMLFRRPEFAGGPSPMSFGFFTSPAGSERRLSISGANPGFMAALMIYPDRALTVAVLANSWGYGARSGDMTDALPKRLADLCSAAAPFATRSRHGRTGRRLDLAGSCRGPHGCD
jgi:CubicO group peptidase (beta-lactamase class C family)